MPFTICRPVLALPYLALLAPMAAASPGDVTFNGSVPVVSYSDVYIRHLLPADFDGDGLLDLVGSGGKLNAWRQTQGGELTPLPLPDFNGLPLVLDLDGDGLMSLVGVSTNGLKACEFEVPFVYGPTEELSSADDGGGYDLAVSGDLDGDGNVDILADSPTGLRTWLSDGTGSLLPSIPASSVGTGSTELGDLNLDGTLDMLAGLDGTVTPLLGIGDGTFAAQAPITVPEFVWDVALGDLDGDGLLDAAIAGNAGVQLLLGTGGGGFTAWMAATVDSASSVDLGDADGDGDDDAVFSANSSVRVQLVDAGGLGASRGFLVVGVIYDALFAPLHPDVPQTVLASQFIPQYGDVVVVDCGVDGLPKLEQEFESAPTSVPLALADVDGDGHDELVANDPAHGQIVVHEIPGDGTIGVASAGTPVAEWPEVRPMFLDGDAREDLLVSALVGGTQRTWLPWLSNGDGTFTPGPIIHQAPYNGTDAVGDVDGDGDDDLLISAAYDPAGPIIWLANLGGGNFAPAVAVSFADVVPQASIALADADEDGFADAFTITSELPGIITWWKGAGDGTFSTPQVLVSGPNLPVLRVCDLEGDGHMDLVAQGMIPVLPPSASEPLIVVHGHGDGQFDAPRFFPAGTGVSGVVPETVDFDHDGRLDVLVFDGLSASPMLLPQAADGSFGGPRQLPFAAQLGFPTADVDGDGDEDFLFAGVTLGPDAPGPLRVGWVNVKPDEALDLGHAKLGTAGVPVLTGGGDLQPTQAVHIDLAAAPASVPLLLLVGLETGYQPFAGGTLVPLPQGVLSFNSSADGSFALLTRWPAGAPPGLTVYAQCWCTDPITGEAVASNALQFEGK